MPFLNDRFYINPSVGRAREAAREAEEEATRPRARRIPKQISQSGTRAVQNQNGHWVTINGQHVLIGAAQDGKAKGQQPQNEKEAYLAVVVFNETGGLSALTVSGRGSAEDLHQARIAVAEVANRLRLAGRGNQVAQGEGGMFPGLWEGLHQGNQAEVTAWNDSLAAGRAALAGSNITNDAGHFRLDSKGGRIPSWGKTPSLTFGPFRNTGGGDATPRPHIYIYRSR